MDGGVEINKGNSQDEPLLTFRSIDFIAADLGDDHEGTDYGKGAGDFLADGEGHLIWMEVRLGFRHDSLPRKYDLRIRFGNIIITIAT